MTNLEGAPQPGSLHECPDQIVGQVFLRNNRIFASLGEDDFPQRESIDYGHFKSRRGNVLLVMESPHKDEYKEPFGPAKGSTGRQIRRHLQDLEIPGLSCPDSVRDLILVNAIPFQCSLGVATKGWRDKVFRATWRNSRLGADYFEERIRKLLHKETILLNCCTQGEKDSEGFLNDLVHDRVLRMAREGSKFLYARGKHPYSWFSEGNRVAELVPLG